MEYTIKQLSDLSGVSTRALRYYDEIALLRPARINESGYRFYGTHEVDRLQQILFYRELDFPLADIQRILDSPDYDNIAALRKHKRLLEQRRERLEQLIRTVENTLRMQEGELEMMDNEKFEGFKENLVKENEKRYGTEIREKYGDKEIDASNQKVLNMNQTQYAQSQDLENKVIELFLRAYKTGNPSSNEAQEAVECHRQWLCMYWTSYSPEMHFGVAQMYVDDPRFTEYYDKHQAGLAVFIRDAVKAYVEI